ncbi:hypothetical protein EST38_g9916 [Candolleomyces aberdarensis]|uniref:Gfd2/YDR514C-like C-terminal domain-containing protein n=1 Tax=Candolleomyces aberdarensis TaxID=2316362 RepID=A0A4V1Q2Q8_9AGAR|nr:hypothetical protein EST38_g9916 [Candolleomyces aberdarensis]
MLWFTLITHSMSTGSMAYSCTLENGEARLMFSLKQVDYIRYWLHALGLTKEVIPLPYSDCLMTNEELRTVSPITYEDGTALRGALKAIDKNNKKLKGTNTTLSHRRLVFERVRSFWAEKKGVWCSMDFESWERDHTMITEFGWSLIGWKDGEKVEERGHFSIQEYEWYRNGRFVAENRENYRFGQTEKIKKKDLKTRIADLFKVLEGYGLVFLVFHDNSQDIKDLKRLEVPLTNLTHILPDNTPDSGLFVVDTSDLIGALLGDDSGNRRGLEKMCRLLQINPMYLHNAGNDAHYTLEALVAMAGGEQVDKQREERWPNQTAAGTLRVKVEANDSDYESDDEEIGPRLGYDP